MRAGVLAVCIAIGVCALGALWALRPFAAALHAWGVALASALAGAFLVFAAISTLRSTKRHERFAALCAFGGALAAGAIVTAGFAVGSAARVPAAPGQVFVPGKATRVAVEFPAIPASVALGGDPSAWPQSVIVADGSRRIDLAAGDEVRAGTYVFRALLGPIARVTATALDGRSVTVTQPQGAAFASPYLTFPAVQGGQPSDLFAVPALHRIVRVAYYAGLPAHRIDIPFVLVQIDEENGGTLYQGVAVSGRPIRRANLELEFFLGSYPVVFVASAPPLLPLLLGVAATAVGLVGFLLTGGES